MDQHVDLFLRHLIKEALSFNDNKTFTPPTDVVLAAQHALETVSPSSMSGGGNKGNGANKARQLAQGAPQTLAQMKRMLSFFRTEEHKNEKDQASWAMYGGDKAYAWVKREVERLNTSNLRSKKTARAIGGAGKNKGMGTLSTNLLDPNNTRERSVWSGVKNRGQNKA